MQRIVGGGLLCETSVSETTGLRSTCRPSQPQCATLSLTSPAPEVHLTHRPDDGLGSGSPARNHAPPNWTTLTA